MDETKRAKLIEEWRERATKLDAYARIARREGDNLEAADAEEIANDYRIAADLLELGEAAA